MQLCVRTLHILMVFVLACIEVKSYHHKFKRARYEARKSKSQNKIYVSSVSNSFAPQQIHICYGKEPTDLVIMWATVAKVPKMSVQYSFNTKITDFNTVVGEQVELTINNEKGVKYLHRAYLKDLKPATVYYYKIISKQNGVSSELLQFNVPSIGFDHFQSYMVLADMGPYTHNLQNIVHEAKNNEYTSVFHIGDIGYDLYTGKGSNGDKFLNNIQPMTAKVPYLLSPGDHEAKYEFTHYRYRFSMPTLSWPMKAENLYYSFDIGPTHFISLNTEMLFHVFKKDYQLAWLEKDLIAVNKRSERPWIIVMGHRALYSSCENRKDCLLETPIIKKTLEPLFFKYGVDMYFGGHYHNYERSWPVYKDKVLDQHYKYPKAPVYITIGTLGQKYLPEPIKRPSGQWSAKTENKECFGVLEIFNSTHLHWKVLAASNNAKIDQIWVIQKNKVRTRDSESYLKYQGRNPADELPPEPFIVVGKPEVARVNFLHIRRNMPFKDSGLLVALITVCSVVFFICIFSKRLWRR